MKKKLKIIFTVLISIFLSFLIYIRYEKVNAPYKNFSITEKKITLKENVKLSDFIFSINDITRHSNSNEEFVYTASMNIKKTSNTGKNFFYNLYIVPHYSGINQTRGIKTKNMDQITSHLEPYLDYTGDVTFTLKKNKYTESNISLVFIQHEGKKYTKYYYTIEN